MTAPRLVAAPLFGPRGDYFVGRGPIFVAIGDLNGDRKPDVVTAKLGSNGESQSISVLLGTGDGSLVGLTDFATGVAPTSVAIGDVNGDGKPDLAVANQLSNSVSVLLGDGSGSFAPKTDFATGSAPFSVAIADLNADGKPDLAVANFNLNTVSVLLGMGDGTFGTKRDFGTGRMPAFVAIGDLNRDGKPDLVTADYGQSWNRVSVLLGKGDGSFGFKTDYFVGSNPAALAIGDLNGDGKPDLAVANSVSNTVSLLFGDGNGAFNAIANYGTGTQPYSVAIGDLDGDGRPDLAVANSGPDNENTVSILLGRVDGTYGPKIDYHTGGQPYSVAMGDLNGDGGPDLVTANFADNTLSVFLNTNMPTPTALALVEARARPDAVDLVWFAASMSGSSAAIDRKVEGAEWSRLATVVGDAAGRLSFEDTDVRPGARYGYRLGVRVGDVEEFYGETWVTLPAAWVLAVIPAGPNPDKGRLAMTVTLPSRGPARLDVFDSSGRRVAHRDLGSPGPGQQVVAFAEAATWRPGVYTIRLEQGPNAVATRACVLR